MATRLEQEILLAHALGVKRIDLYNHPELIPPPIYRSYLQRLENNEPLAYIVGYQPFYGLDIEVNRSVLIPRPETEELVELAINTLKCTVDSGQGTVIADIGTGSGSIAVALAKNLPNAKVVGIDVSEETLTVAKRNAEKHGVADRCDFVLQDVRTGFIPVRDYDLIIANLPYIPTSVIDTLEPNVKDWEPRGALDGGPDGLDYIRHLLTYAPKNLLFEFGFDQAAAIRKLAGDKVTIKKDASGHDRFAIICS